MQRFLFMVTVLSCLLANVASAEDDFFSRTIVVPTPKPSAVKIHQNLTYLETTAGDNRADIYLPANTKQKRPAIIFIHGGPIPKDLPPAKDWGFFQSYGALVTGAGFAGVTFNHSFNSLNDLQSSNDDIQAAVSFIRSNADKYAIDKDNICLWFYSGSGSFVAPFLKQQPQWLKCMVIYYGILGPKVLEEMGQTFAENQHENLKPLPLLKSKLKPTWRPAIFIAEAGEDKAELNLGLQRFSKTAKDNAWPVEYWSHTTGPHGFDLIKDDQRSREIILTTLDFLSLQLNDNKKG